ncbi:MAG: Rne/Rng family ribonuclease [Alphaproteobacteria bacterium]|nr:Rne/Rng family ribonuclease [Alphaproteobacteria bacterium]
MTKRMLIDAAHADETRVVLLDNDQVYDYDFVTSSKTQNKGNIYLAKITRVEPSLQAAFVEYGGGKQGFLPFSEIHPDYYQLPQNDKQKLLEEQIAEAEAEEAAEDEAFEREQAARESRRRGRGGNADNETDSDDDDFAADDELTASDNQSTTETLVAVGELAAPDSAVESAMGDLPPVEVPAHSFDMASGNAAYAVEPLNAESFAVHSDPLPEENFAADELNTEATTAEEGNGAETTAEDSEETRSRGNRGGRTAFHRRYRIQEVIKRNQIVLVQVIKEERGNKGCSLTTFISLAGRAAVLMPNSPKGGGISRKITDRETRRRLKEVASEMRTHKGMSVIIRTAGIDRTKAEIRRDYEYLVKLWNQIREQTLASSAPALIYEEGNLIKRSLRDLYTNDVEEVIVEGEEGYNEAKDFMRMLMPSNAARVKLYKESMPLFSFAGVEDQLSGMTDPQVRLPSGGYLVIHPTEALISIDVNSGRSTTERNVEETAIKTNIEAAMEIGRQLRLRDLAGLIVIDFIDMGYGKNRKQVERAMKDALKADRAKIQVGRISSFGLMELSRQRLRPSISEAMGVMCPHCRGTGYIHSVETVGINIIRILEKEAATGEYVALRITTHPEAALYLLNDKRASLQALEQRYNVTVAVLMDASIITGNHRLIKITAEGREITHDNSAASQQNQRGGRGGARRGRRGGRDGQSGHVINFDRAVITAPEDEQYVSDSVNPDDDEIIGVAPSEGNVEFAPREPRTPREPRRERGERSERGGRDRNRNRNRGDRPDRTPRDPAQVAAAIEGGETQDAAPVELDENGQPRERGDRNRRRGRRGGRNRARTDRPRREDGSIGNPIRTSDATADTATDAAPRPTRESEPRNSYEPAAASYSSASEPAARPASIIPLSEKQTNPAAIASPIISHSSGEGDKAKRKGWWSRVLEN